MPGLDSQTCFGLAGRIRLGAIASERSEALAFCRLPCFAKAPKAVNLKSTSSVCVPSMPAESGIPSKSLSRLVKSYMVRY
jgi:hypothetical protein